MKNAAAERPRLLEMRASERTSREAVYPVTGSRAVILRLTSISADIATRMRVEGEAYIMRSRDEL